VLHLGWKEEEEELVVVVWWWRIICQRFSGLVSGEETINVGF
jgi:hypothetical protein